MIPLLLAGPAGSGKTHRCLAEIADDLRASSSDAPLILLAPRQATYQLERQILSFPGVEGFTRLHILSFHRLAQFVLEVTKTVAPKMLDEEGRVMVMRAILARRQNELRVYRESAQRDGLAQELSDLWREICEHRAGPIGLRKAAAKIQNSRLRAKLEDFAIVFTDYQNWLNDNSLRDGDEMLDLAAEAALKGTLPTVGGLWLDGFAQMTPQERRLLNAILPKCAKATLAFCLPERPLKPGDAFSMWSVVARTYCAVRDEVRGIFQAPPREETLARRRVGGRFDAAPMLAHLEEWWGNPRPYAAPSGPLRTAGPTLRVVKCANVEAEAVFVARQVLKFVRSGGRFREAAVLVRSLDDAADALRRVFRRYEIPFFLDRRESVAHHPLAELTRGALRTIAFGFKHHDLFAALKSGLIGVSDDNIDWFENVSLARGWNGNDWRAKLNCGPKAHESEVARVEEIRQGALKPIFRLERMLGPEPTGRDLAEALRDFWTSLDVEAELERWAEGVEGTLHATVWSQMTDWLESVETAFKNERMSLGRWLEIVEAGLAALTVGLIPPSLDQVLIGAVDRSRNPDLRSVFLVGVNEGLFPRAGREDVLLNDDEREKLDESGVRLGVTSLWNLGAEQFYGYIGCTRARSSLTLTYAETAADGEPLNPSLFVAQLKRLFPKLEEEQFGEVNPLEAEAAHELNSVVFGAARGDRVSSESEKELLSWPKLAPAWERARAGAILDVPKLSPTVVAGLYGNRLRTSASKLEQFAMCPFRFFVASGLRAQERLLFELDRREEGSFQHEVLAEFHRRVEAMGKRWRDVSPSEGRDLLAEIGVALKGRFQEGLAEATASNRFRAEAKLAALQDFIEAYLELLRDCDFDPRSVELGFGGDGPLPAWELEIDQRRKLQFAGRIDRVDIWRDTERKRAYALVFDYKSSERKLHRVLVENWIQQQLLAYLVALEKVGVRSDPPFELRAAGAFYVNLRMGVSGAKSRAIAFDKKSNDSESDLRQTGVFDWQWIDRMDRTRAGRLFDFQKKGEPITVVNLKGLPSEQFAELLRKTEAGLRDLGRRIFEGEAAIAPYEFQTERPCGNCLYAGICRVDPWTHAFRNLEEASE
jgi:ATP-dependent helicase/nuclease subunit B